MNKIMLTIIITSFILFSADIKAEGFEGDKKPEINFDNWNCQYCPESEKWDIHLNTHLGILDDSIYHFGNYSGFDDDVLLFFSGDANMQNEDGHYWKTSFQNLGLDSIGIQSDYGKQGNYALMFDFQSIPVRKFDQLLTPFTDPGSNSLLLPNDWNRSDNGRNFTSSDIFSRFSLGTDWDLFKLKLNVIGNNNFDFSTSYRRLEKEGIREFSASQIINATFLPFPVDQKTEDFNATINYANDQWYASLAVNISRFENELDSVIYATPFIPLVDGSGIASLSTAPDNTSTKLSVNTQYRYAPRSFAKLRYSIGKLKQDEAFLPSTTNQNLLTNLPRADLDGEVDTQDLSIQLNHWFDPKWSLRAKYRHRDRDNKSPQLLFQPVVTDAFIASSLLNLPYDFTKKSSSVQLDYRLLRNQLISLSYKMDERTRNFQSVYKTTDDGFAAKYRATILDNLTLMVNGEKLSRDSSALQLIDFLGVSENPLMQRFNVADREQDKYNVQLYYSPINSFSAAISGQVAEQDYDKTVIGLTNNRQENFNIDFSWMWNEVFDISVFFQQEEIKTRLNGSNNFSTPDWRANNLDEVDSYGVSFSFKELLDSNLDLSLDFDRSDADTMIIVNQSGIDDKLPTLSSLWSHAELKLDYQYSDNMSFIFSYQYQEFESSDFAIDGVVPGTLTNLLTFGAFSNNYDVNYWIISMGYKF